MDPVEKPSWERKEWDLNNGCTIHDAHGGTKWGMDPHLKNRKADLKDIHIAFASVRQSSDLIDDHVPDLINEKLDIYDDELYTDENTKKLWRAFGVEENVVEDVSMVSLFAQKGRIHVNRKLTAIPDWKNWLCSRLLTLYTLGMFTQSRFLSLGTCSRGMMAALAGGLGILVDMLIADKTVHQHFIRGFRRLKQRLRRLFFFNQTLNN